MLPPFQCLNLDMDYQLKYTNMKRSNFIGFLGISAMLLASCNNMNRAGENVTPEGTTTTNAVNSNMENNRTPAGTDTLMSPGSNAMDLKENANISNKGTGASSGQQGAAVSPGVTNQSGGDKNLKNQSDTHGRSTQDGDNGSEK
jgi:predicted small secreted protein